MIHLHCKEIFINSLIVRLILLLSIFALSSCATKNIVDEKYPEDWASIHIESDGRCSSISGSYSNLGETANKRDFVPTLDGSVFSRPALVRNRGRVDIVHEADTGVLEIKLVGAIYRQDKNLWSSFEEKVICADDWLSLNEEISAYSDGTFTKGKSIISFAKDINGNLRIRNQVNAISSSLIIFLSLIHI